MVDKVYFKCRLSNTVVGFEYEWDIEEMRKHPQYDEIKEIPDGLQTKEEQDTEEKVKKPRKAKEAK